MVLKIDEGQFLADMAALAKIGDTGDGGVSRPAMSPEDVQGRAWLRDWAEREGFEFLADGAGNLSVRLAAADPDARTLLMGSHLDSVRNGGRFDGALGVLSALAALRAIRDAKIDLPFHLEAISFTDEEGSIFGLLGSSALAGHLTKEELMHPRGGREALEEGMARIGISDESILSAGRDGSKYVGYLELHIEQGTRLEDANLDIGVVTSIVGIYSYRLRFFGEAAHAGTKPMERRKDALWGAAEFALRAKDLVMEKFSPGVVNCGQASIAPGAFNIVPGEVELALEFRHGTAETLAEMETALLDLAHEAAANHGLTLEAVPVEKKKPAAMSEPFMQALEHGADALGLSHTRLMSFAGHDPQNAVLIMPGAMFFVPSLDGVSHNPAEFTSDADCINGANVLLNAALRLAEIEN